MPMLVARFLMFVGILVCVECTRSPRLPKGFKWNEETGQFSWSRGEFKLPRGFTYQFDYADDTLVGHFTSPDGRIVIKHDIGGYAGAWASRAKSWAFNETVSDGARVWVARRKWPDGKQGDTILVAVTFPDSGCTNFYLKSSRAEEGAVIDSIARSFQPKGKVTPPTPHVCGD